MHWSPNKLMYLTHFCICPNCEAHSEYVSGKEIWVVSYINNHPRTCTVFKLCVHALYILELDIPINLVARARRAITWSNADPVQWRIYVSRGGDAFESIIFDYSASTSLISSLLKNKIPPKDCRYVCNHLPVVPWYWNINLLLSVKPDYLNKYISF